MVIDGGMAARARVSSLLALFVDLAGKPCAKLVPVEASEAFQAQTLARACGTAHLRNLEPEDLVALTVEAAVMARVPLAGTSWVPGT